MGLPNIRIQIFERYRRPIHLFVIDQTLTLDATRGRLAILHFLPLQEGASTICKNRYERPAQMFLTFLPLQEGASTICKNRYERQERMFLTFLPLQEGASTIRKNDMNVKRGCFLLLTITGRHVYYL